MDNSIKGLVGFAFIVGVFAGYIFSGSIASLVQGKQDIYTCPPIATVLANKDNTQAWMDGELQWSPLTQGNELSESLVFFQAMLQRAGNSMICYYRYQKPGYAGSFANYMLQLNPSAKQLIKTDGNHWRNTAITAICLSGDVKTCGFNVDYQ